MELMIIYTNSGDNSVVPNSDNVKMYKVKPVYDA